MSLNKSKGNMYEFVTHTWNTVKGACPHGCTYCYMKRWGKQKPVRMDEKELRTDLGSGNFIFVGSSCDMFAEEIPAEWIEKTLEHCKKHDNSYLFQSKNPVRIFEYRKLLPVNSVVCTTIESDIIPDGITNWRCPGISGRVGAMAALHTMGMQTYVTIEPVMDFDTEKLLQLIEMCHPEQVNIGADSGNNHLPEPSAEKLRDLITGLKEFTTIHNKSNLGRLQPRRV